MSRKPDFVLRRSGNPRFEMVPITVVTVVHETEKALLIEVPDGTEHWIPRSQVPDDCDIRTVGDSGDLLIPRWLAEEKGLVEKEV